MNKKFLSAILFGAFNGFRQQEHLCLVKTTMMTLTS